MSASTSSLGLAFLTGLTTGGLSCLAVQAGLLASSVARQAEGEIHADLAAKETARRQARKLRKQQRFEPNAQAAAATEPRRQIALPILLFLGSKLTAYTVLGFFLGWLGSVLQLTAFPRALLQFAIGVFMIGTALRLFNVHPIFRYFAIEPPRFLTRFIRRFAKNSESSVATAVLLGALTVLIPCGVTQAMMALAVGSGSPIAGALIMLAFTLGTTPVFFGLAYVATRLGKALEARFFKLAGAVVLVLGVLSIEGGLNLIGSPWSFTNLADTVVAGTPAEPGGNQPPSPQVENGVLRINVQNYGYTPSRLQAKAGEPVTLSLTTNGTEGCTRAFVVPALHIQRVLPQSGTTTIDLPPQAPGTLRFTCSMGMYSGQIAFT